MVVEPALQLPAYLEGRHRLRSHCDCLTGPRIPAVTRLPLLDEESAEVPQLDPLAACQRLSDLIENRRHDQLDISAPQMRVAGGQVRDEV
jgi:hypothetical protein